MSLNNFKPTTSKVNTDRRESVDSDARPTTRVMRSSSSGSTDSRRSQSRQASARSGESHTGSEASNESLHVKASGGRQPNYAGSAGLANRFRSSTAGDHGERPTADRTGSSVSGSSASRPSTFPRRPSASASQTGFPPINEAAKKKKRYTYTWQCCQCGCPSIPYYQNWCPNADCPHTRDGNCTITKHQIS